MNVKQLRTQCGLTQAGLAKKAKVSQAFIAQLETGEQDNPTLDTLRRLAKALGVSVAELTARHPHSTARAARVSFDPLKVFPLNDPASVPLLRLMLATDDVRHLQKLIARASEGVNEDNKTEKAILEGETGHLFRLFCGHLYEAGQAFRFLDRKVSQRLDAVVASSKSGKESLAFLREGYRAPDPRKSGDEGGVAYSFLYPVRNFIGFHYGDQKLREAIQHHQDSEVFRGSVALVEDLGLGRYTFTDLLVQLVIADALGGDLNQFVKKYPDRMKTAVRLAGALAEVTDHLLQYAFDQSPEAVLSKEEDRISIPPTLQTLFAQYLREENGG